MIKKIAVLFTCYNRKEKTIRCFKHLFEAQKQSENRLELEIFLTDDGSVDGTARAISDIYPETHILKGNGNLFWAGGMRNSWQEALKKSFDGYLLMNDDTYVFPNFLDELVGVHQYAIGKYGCGGIYIGSTSDDAGNYSYGGSVLRNKFFFNVQSLIPNGKIQECEFGNGNIMLVMSDVTSKIGIISAAFKHISADYDYTLKARSKNIPVLLTPHYCGICCDDRLRPYEKFKSLPLAQRKIFLYSPKGFAFGDHITFTRRNFPFRLPFILLAGWLKVCFPNIYTTIKK